MHSLFGLELPTPVNFIVAFVVVLALIGAAAWAVRKFGAQRLEAATRGRQPRLAVIDSAVVDNRRKLVIIRRDNVEHLLMIGGATDVVVETNIVRATATRDAPAVREAPALRASATVETMPRAMPLPDPTPWPLQPEPALTSVPALRSERVRAIEEPSTASWPTAHVEPQIAPPVAPAAPQVRPQRSPDTLSGHATEFARPEPVRAIAPPSPAPVAMAPEPVADQNLAEMAQRLEAALRRPSQAVKPAAAEAPARPTPATEAKRTEPKAAPKAAPAPAPQPAAAPAKAEAPAKPTFDSLEQEMASLLGRPGKT